MTTSEKLRVFFEAPLVKFIACTIIFISFFALTRLDIPVSQDTMGLQKVIESASVMVEPIAYAEPASFQPLERMAYHAPDSPNLFEGGNCTYYVKGRRPDIPNEFGNANTWDDVAREMGYTVSGTPIVGAVGVSNSGYYGHVVYVEEISGDQVFVSEMNVHGLWVTDKASYPIDKFVYIY